MGNESHTVKELERELKQLRQRVHLLEEMESERTMAEVELRKLSRAVAQSASLILITDPQGNIEYVNPKFAEVTGYAQDEIVGKNARILKSGETPDSDYAKMWQDIAQGKEWRGEFHNKKKNGEFFWAFASLSPITDESGLITHYLAVEEDISERKRVEKALEQSKLELERSNAELERFASIASHDLREPLRVIAGFTKLLAKRYRGQLDSEAEEYIAYIIDGTHRLQRLIDDLLAYSRVGTRGAEFELTDCNLILETAISNLSVAIEESTAAITYDGLPEVQGDGLQLEQLFQNLISNAIKFRGEDRPKVHISCVLRDDEWEFAVQDNGIGIEPRFADRIFVIFQRLHTQQEYPGTGIGLAICQRIVERHGGGIWFESDPGKGSTFYFTVPKVGIG